MKVDLHVQEDREEGTAWAFLSRRGDAAPIDGAYADLSVTTVADLKREIRDTLPGLPVSAIRAPSAGAKIGYLTGVELPEALQGRGLGRKLVEAVLLKAAAAGVRVVYVAALHTAEDFYRALDFESLDSDRIGFIVLMRRHLRGSAAPLATTQVRWRDLRLDDNEAVLEYLRQRRVPLPVPPDRRLVVEARSMDDVWREARRWWPGPDHADGKPIDMDTENHWDYRGPAHVLGIAQNLRLRGLNPRQGPAAVLQRWMGPSPAVEYDWSALFEYEAGGGPPEATWEGHSSLAPKARRVPGRDPGIPPLNFYGAEFVDGRHRAFAARVVGLRWVPVLDLAQLSGGAKR
jgi:GNAT superfamily N-acetyltransferase